MREFIKNSLSIGLGLLDFIGKQGRKIIQELVRRGDLKKEEGNQLFSKLINRAENSRQDLEKRVEKSVKEICAKLELVQKKDFDRVVKRLEKRIDSCCKPTGGRGKKAA